MILRAFSANPNDKQTTIPELSNKIGFFFTGEILVTVHQKSFAFLQELPGHYESPEELILKILVEVNFFLNTFLFLFDTNKAK